MKKLLFLLIVLLVSVYPLFYKFAQFQERTAYENWANSFDPIENLQTLFPTRADNEAAVQLKQLAIRLGIEFTIPREDARFSPIYMDAKRHKPLAGYNGPLAKYIRKQLEKPDQSVDLPEDAVAAYLSDYRNSLDAVRDHIQASPSIEWRQNLNDWDIYEKPDTAIPMLPGIIELQRVLVARALVLTAHRRYSEAKMDLQAGWRLNEALRTHSDMLSQLIALWTDYQWLGVIRKLPVDLAWTHKISQHDYRESFLKAFQVEAWLLWRLRDQPITDHAILNPVLDPYVRLCVASHLEKEREEIEALRGLRPCSLRKDDFYEFPKQSRWNRVHRVRWIYQKKAIYGRLIKLQIDRELTAKIILAKHGYVPPENSEWSTACPDGFWAYRALPDGATSIEYASPLEIPHEPIPVLPTSFVLRQ